MNEQQLREIAEAAFKRQFGDIEVVGVNIRRGLGFEDDSPVVHVDIIYDDEDGQVARCGYLGVLSEILDKTWYEGEENLGYPLVHLLVKSGQRGRTTASQCGMAAPAACAP